MSGPLKTNRHYNKARELLGKVSRLSINPPDKYPEIGVVEVTNAITIVAELLAELEFYKKKND